MDKNMDMNQELKALLHNPHFRHPDLSGQVMQRLYTGEREARKPFWLKYKISLLVTAGLLLTASTGFAAVQYQSLKNRQGELVYQVKPAQEFPAFEEEELQRLNLSRELGEELLAPGTAAIFYILEHNPDGKLDTQNKPVNYSDLASLRTKLSGQDLALAGTLPGGYKFQEAAAYFEPVTPATDEEAAIADQLRKQAEAAGRSYGMMPVRLSDQILNVTAVYKQGDQEVTVTARRATGVSTAYVDEQVDFTAEKVTAGDTQMIYTKYKGGNSLSWSLDIPGSDETYQYQLDEMSGQFLSKEEMIALAEPFLE
ncbi:DUF4367 domain-containing protein [Paenibacillus sp. MMS20-IR301]|uniref:DUF4367 domain-containing protein n=1 Tax=Paenibacillus sp. MMS20-IR301 TaxID=2895946 RepID=UPI0028E41A1A|nr:DUF4367 domain-containing protein [Paenibacillus sp. MMS20-IR301]WNS42405.1 hypothetical protein LOS79_26010 [Paenibacillus sp. MMS20-IR301]